MKVTKIALITCIATFFYALSFTNSKQYHNDVPQFLHKFIPHLYNNAQVVLSLICYKREILFKIVRNSPFPVRFQNLNRSINDSHNHKLVYVTDLNCPNVTNILENFTNPAVYSNPSCWIMFTYQHNSIPSIEALPDSNIFLIIPKRDRFQIIQMYKIEQNAPNRIERYGIWSSTSNLHIQQTEKILSKRRKNLHKKMLTASVVINNNETLSHLDDYKNNRIDSLTKINFIISKILISAVNGTLNYIPVDTWGYENEETGEWNGMIGELVKKTADFTGTGLFVTSSRIYKVDYLSLTSLTKIKFMFRAPPLSYVANIYSLPFTPPVWISGTALVGLAVIVIFLTINIQRKIIGLKNSEDEHFRFSDFLLLGISGLCQMGSFVQAKILSAKISMIFFLVVALFLYTSYTANIVALLQSTTKSIRTLSDLLNSQLELGVEDTPYNRYYFPVAADPIRKAIYEKKVLSSDGVPKYMSVSDGMAKLRKGLFAFHVELGLGYQIIEETFYEHEKCNLMTIAYIQASDPWFATRKNFPYKEILKVNLFRIREYGLQSRENSRFYSKKPSCSAGGKNFESVRFNDCYVILVILGVGYISAIFLFLIEQILKKFKLDKYYLKM